MNTQVKSRLLAGALLVSVAVPSFAQTQPVSVRLNGQPLALSATPLQLNGRTLLPLRDVFESLGAQVNWNPVAQSIAAQSGTTQIQLGINNPVAFVNGRNVTLDQPAILVGGKAFVPLRFVAEATGAQVDYNSQLQLVSIQKNNIAAGSPAQVADYTNDNGNQVPAYNAPAPVDDNAPPPPYNPPAQTDYTVPANDYRNDNIRTISVPSDSIVPVQLDTALSSKDARVGDRFTATVVSHRLGDSEFPAGTKIEGLITEARPSQGRNPGVLDFDFQNAILPDGTRVPLRGDLTSLDQNDVSQNGGRLMAKGGRKSDTLKVVGIGAGAGFVLGRVLGGNSTISTILGAGGGYLYSRSRNQKAQEARLAANTTLGVRLMDPVRFPDSAGYMNVRRTYLARNNGAFDPNYYGYDSRINGAATDQYDGYNVSDRLPAPAPQDGTVDDYRPTDPADNNQNNGDGNTNDNNWNNGNGDPDANNQNDGNTRDNNWNNDNNGRNNNWNNGNANNGNGHWNNAPVNNGTWNNGNDDNLNNANDGNWNNGNDPNTAGRYAQRISVPEGAVVPIRVDQQISSATAHVGDQVSATIDSQRMGDSEFPAGTRIMGTVVEARPRDGDNPGVLDFDFNTAQLPDGTRVPLRGELISLDDKGVQPQGGRLVATQKKSSKDRAKIIGIGAVAGFAVGRILKKDGVLPSVLGALGGYIYSQKNNKSQVREAVVPQNSRLGFRLDDNVSYNGGTYYASRAQYLRQN